MSDGSVCTTRAAMGARSSRGVVGVGMRDQYTRPAGR
jgi:hypothetical protein